MTDRRRLVISMGDPTGIGPEVIVKAMTSRPARVLPAPIVVGDPGVLSETARRLGIGLPVNPWAPPAPIRRHAMNVRAIARLTARERRPGHPTLAGGRAAYAAIVEAVRLIDGGYADALVTAPICKANLAAAGVGVAGHTELLVQLTGRKGVRMMMVGSRLRVILVTTHLALRQVPGALSRQAVFETVVAAHSSLRRHFGVPRPRIAVVGLNPHAGEAGLFGREEQQLIAPAVRRARRRGIEAIGPLAADSVFAHAAAGRFDVVVCMYHDQGLAPFKLLHFADGVNCTVGLPFVRTSPDHGTAHDIAGRGVADPSSMIAALMLAAQQSLLRRAA